MIRVNKRNILSVFAIILAGFLFIGWSDTWDGLKSSSGKVTSISAEFTQEKHLRILTKPLVSKGIIYYQAPRSLRWEYKSPIRSILLMHHGKIRRYIEGDSGLTEDPGAGLQAMEPVLQEITRWLKGDFGNNPMFSASFKGKGKIVLAPKEKAFASIIKRIELILSDRPGVIKSVTIYEGKDSFTRIEFQNVRVNEPLKDSLFQEIS
ncbi:MAG: outer membrane lipoprotein carrier protein LolA [Deltaproteobacteria bacterium]|nr:outer membrane lipoprotein carrier protein LolA [Deltaproteobacteria bacterium]MBW2116747.1 outer membrane lipoprotein carrier protein LolA [Deltaproteobacteria bacterium]